MDCRKGMVCGKEGGQSEGHACCLSRHTCGQPVKLVQTAKCVLFPTAGVSDRGTESCCARGTG